MRKFALLFLALAACACAHAQVFARVRGLVHDPQHQPLAGASVTLHAAHSAETFHATTGPDGLFVFSTLPLGDYKIEVAQPGFRTLDQTLTLAAGASPVLHFELALASVQQTVSVDGIAETVSNNTPTPLSLVDREAIAHTPGADRSNSMAMIVDYTPGAYMTHDMLHMRGGHQVSWLIDGVQIPNTNIGSNLAAQIDPNDIDYLEVERGSYSADTGDRTYGVFNVLPRTGFERDRAGELLLTAGNFLQTDDQLSLGDHNERAAWYASASGSRSDFGLAPPTQQVRHDRTDSLGAFGSLIFNRTPKDQLRAIAQFRQDFFQVPFDPDPDSIGNSQYQSSGLRDTQKENDGLATVSWLHTFNPSVTLQLSPFVHGNSTAYTPQRTDTPIASNVDRTSFYAGAQATLSAQLPRNTVQAGLFSFGQHDSDTLGATFNDATGTPPLNETDAASGGLIEAYVSDNIKLNTWFSITAGLRGSWFHSAFNEHATAPRIGAVLRIPRLNWAVRGFYGRFYQPPPLLTASGPVIAYASTNNTAFAPLHGERDEEHQFGIAIPLRGWVLDADTFKTRVNNFLDHANIGSSSLYFPVTIDGALIRAWELTLRTPRSWRFGQGHLAYSNQIAEQRGSITGGLICTPLGDPACDAGFTYTPVDHDQRNTLNIGFNARLPRHAFAAIDLAYGSGFVNGSYDPSAPPADPRFPNPYLPQHTTLDASIGKDFGQRFSASLTATNLANHRVLLDNSLTFGGFHYNDPRQLYAQLRYRFHF